MRFFPAILGALALLCLAGLAACTVVVDEDIPGPGPQYCSREYNPVCARAAGDRRTFANACLADQAGYDIIRRGECRQDRVEQTRFCTREYRPVCARRQGQYRTFGNECEADASGFRIVSDGPC